MKNLEGITYVYNPIYNRDYGIPGRLKEILNKGEEWLERVSSIKDRIAYDRAPFMAFQVCCFAICHPDRIKETGRSDQELRCLRQKLLDLLIKKNGPLVISRIRSKMTDSADWEIIRRHRDDFYSASMVCLLNAVIKFDPWRGFQFSTYASRAIHNAFKCVSNEKQRRSWEKTNQSFFSLQGLEMQDPYPDHLISNEKQLSLLELAADPEVLSEQEQSVIHQRFLAEDTKGKRKTLEMVGKGMGISKQRVGQIQKKALQKLRIILEAAA
ncbi:MAG: sigma-70 family RNA polymerase sigma factor [Patescibacteria group bacterium]